MLAQLWALMKPYRRRFLWGVLMLVLTTGSTMAIPQIFRAAIDGIQESAALEVLQRAAFSLVLLAAAAAVFRTLSRIHIFYAARDVEVDLRTRLYGHLTKLPPSFYLEHPTGDLMSRATNDLSQLRLLFGPGILNTVNTIVGYLIAIPLMLEISVPLTLWGLLVFPPMMALMRYLTLKLYRRSLEQQEQMGQLSSFIQETLAGSAVLRSFVLEPQRQEAFEAQNARYYRTNVAFHLLRSTMFRIALSLAQVAILSVLWLGGLRVLKGTLTAGELVAMVEYLALLGWPTFALGWVLSLWQRGRTALGRIQEILDAPEQMNGGLVPRQPLSASIECRGLSVTLGGRQVLREVSFSLPEGKMLGIVGPVGSGKTTLVSAILRQLETPRGSVFVGGVDTHDLDSAYLRGMIAYVPQRHLLFSRSLAENVAFGKPTAGLDEIQKAVSRAILDDDVRALPQGIETEIGERGITLSGGQKQRTSLARALLLDAPILLLDDTLASVDVQTESRILEELRRTRAGQGPKTHLVISHRLSAVACADEILVLDEGSVTERGSHQELLARGGLYARMTRQQRLAE